MSAPRAPKLDGGRDKILRVAGRLLDEGDADAREVAEMLEDIANGLWSLTDARIGEAQALAREQAETIRNDSWPGGIHGQ